MFAVATGRGAVILTRTGRMARGTLGIDIQCASPIGRGLAAMTACAAAGFVNAVITGDTALGVIGRSNGHAGRVSSIIMVICVGACVLMASFAMAGDAVQAIVDSMRPAAVGELVAGRYLAVGRTVVA